MGAGKTTASYTILPDIRNSKVFIVAKGEKNGIEEIKDIGVYNKMRFHISLCLAQKVRLFSDLLPFSLRKRDNVG